jgi:hypothetical protein
VKSAPTARYEVVLLPGAGAGAGEAARLVAELARLGAAVELGDGPGVVSVATASTVILTAVAAFARRSLGAGLVMDLGAPTPSIAADPGLAHGALVTLAAGGERSVREGLGDQQIGYLLRAGLATTGR